MSGYKYPTTQATVEALSGNVKSVAAAKGCTPGYIHQIGAGETKDPYIDFREWFSNVAEATTTGARAYIRDQTEIVLKFENNVNNVSNESLDDLVSEAHKFYALYMDSRSRRDPLERQRALLIQWREAAERVAISTDREIFKQATDANNHPAIKQVS